MYKPARVAGAVQVTSRERAAVRGVHQRLQPADHDLRAPALQPAEARQETVRPSSWAYMVNLFNYDISVANYQLLIIVAAFRT